MKKCSPAKIRNELYLFIIYFLTGCSILASFSQFISLSNKFGAFNIGELILIMFNDSYTGCFAFTFLYFFIVVLLLPVEQNIYYKIIRYGNRIEYFIEKQKIILINLIVYITVIVIFSILIGAVNSNLDIYISQSTQKFSELYLQGKFESDNLIIEILKIIFSKFLLLYFFASIHLFLSNFKIPLSISFCINTSIMVIMIAMFLGYFGDFGIRMSLFSLSGSIYPFGFGFFQRILILILIDITFFIINLKIFQIKDIILPKGNKQYQNE